MLARRAVFTGVTITTLLFPTFACTIPVHAEVLVSEDFEDGDLRARGWYDIARWGEDESLSIAGDPEVLANTGKRCLKVRYAKGRTGGWMHIRLKEVPEVYVRYYRLFPDGWEWPKGYGPHDSIVFAGSYGAPTDTDLSVYLDFWKSSDTYVRVATARQKWGYGGFAQVLRKCGGVANRTSFNVDPPDKVQADQWHCVEYYGKLSEPGRDNGHLKLWVNGKLVSDLPDVPLVDENHAGILFNHWMLGPYFHGGSHKEQYNYLDSLVIATEYVGTLEQQGNQPPRARFSQTRDWGSMTANFDACRSADPDGEIETFEWDFGDGSSGEGKTVLHTYAQPGDFTVTATVDDGDGERHSFRRTVTVGPDVGSGDGLKAEYYDGKQLSGRPVVKVARQVAFRRQGWNGRFLCSHVGDNQGDHYSCRWTGFVQPTRSEEYTLSFEVNDGGRVWFGDKLIIDAWDGPQTRSASVGMLTAGQKYPIRIEHFKGTFEATRDWKALLYWESPSTEKQLIPATQLYLPAGYEYPRYSLFDYRATLHWLNIALLEKGAVVDERKQRFGFVQYAEGPYYYTVNGVRLNSFGDSLSYGQVGEFDCWTETACFQPPREGVLGCPETWRRYQRMGFNSVRLSTSVPTG